MSTFTFNIDVPIRSEWSNIDLLFTSVKTCFAAMLADVDGCHTMAMVTSELLENAIKYGDWSGKERSLRFHVSGEGRRAQVSVQNPVRDGTVRRAGEHPGHAALDRQLPFARGGVSGAPARDRQGRAGQREQAGPGPHRLPGRSAPCAPSATARA